MVPRVSEARTDAEARLQYRESSNKLMQDCSNATAIPSAIRRWGGFRSDTLAPRNYCRRQDA
jgi:hypothetical protein